MNNILALLGAALALISAAVLFVAAFCQATFVEGLLYLSGGYSLMAQAERSLRAMKD